MDYLVVDIARTLDESSYGQRASVELAKLWGMAQDEVQALRARAAAGDDEAGDRAAALEAQAIQDIERRKDTERRELLDRVRTIVTAIAAERQVSGPTSRPSPRLLTGVGEWTRSSGVSIASNRTPPSQHAR